MAIGERVNFCMGIPWEIRVKDGVLARIYGKHKVRCLLNTSKLRSQFRGYIDCLLVAASLYYANMLPR